MPYCILPGTNEGLRSSVRAQERSDVPCPSADDGPSSSRRSTLPPLPACPLPPLVSFAQGWPCYRLITTSSRYPPINQTGVLTTGHGRAMDP